MPNHVINEVIFQNVDAATRASIIAKVRNDKGEIDFGVLLPKPLNIWDGNVGSKHEKAFRSTGLDWARENWGTKWNAYGLNQGGRYVSIAEGDDTLTLTFQTAWGPPYPWLAALFNSTKLSFDHRWLDEGAGRGVAGHFNYAGLDNWKAGEAWDETEADDELQKHLHKLLWGVEEFPEEHDDEEAA